MRWVLARKVRVSKVRDCGGADEEAGEEDGIVMRVT